jgi:two-component system, NarL family, sensor histidine kinase LiaS
VSYVLVTAIVAMLVGAAFLQVLAPRLLSGADSGARVRATAAEDAATLTGVATRLGRLPNATELRTRFGRLAPGSADPVCDRRLVLGPGQARASGSGVMVPCVPGTLRDDRPMSLMLLVGANGKVVATSYPARFPVGTAANRLVAFESVDDLRRDAPVGGVGGRTPQGGVLWALEPVRLGGKGGAVGPRLGSVYVQVPAGALQGPPANDLLATNLPSRFRLGGVRLVALAAKAPVAVLAGALLLVTVPLGLVLGLLFTGRLRRRVRRLAAATAGMAEGDFGQRATVTGRDELAEVEEGVNRLAEWLREALEADHQQSADASADAERSEMTRRLHESILHDLSSMTVLAGGLRKALPPGSPLGTGVEAIESNATSAMRQLHGLLSQQDPSGGPLDSALAPALQELCGAYEARFGVAVEAEVTPGELAQPVERAVLQVAREALADAVQHRGPRRIALRVAMNDRQVEVDVRDDGRGVDPRASEGGREPGLDLLREWVGQLGGTLRLDRRPGTGTRLLVLLPRGPV